MGQRIQCPHCGASVELVQRHGLSGALCPECSQVVPLQERARSTPLPRLIRPQRIDSRPSCRKCNAPRDREGRRCAACGEPWLYRVSALEVDDEAAQARLVEYVIHREARATDRDRLDERLRTLPTVVSRGLTEAQALRARHELETIGVHVAVEEDDAAPLTLPVRGPRFNWIWLVVPALLLFAVGVVLLVRSERMARQAALPRPVVATAPVTSAPSSAAPEAPLDVLNGLALLRNGARAGFGLVVDRDGWLVAPLALMDASGGVTARVAGQEGRASLVRRDDPLGLGLFKGATPAAFTLSLGDVSTVKAGDTVFVARPGADGPELAPAQVLRPDARRGQRLWLALQARAEELPGAPVFNREGFVLGILLPRPDGQRGLAVPANLLVEDPAGLLTEIRAPRPPAQLFAAWRSRAETEARLANPEIFEAVEKRMLAQAACDDAICRLQVGLLTFGGPPAAAVPLTVELQSVDQAVGDREPRHGRVQVAPPAGAWQEVAPAESALVQDAGVAARRAIVAREVEDLRLFVSAAEIPRPKATLGKSFRVVVTGPDARRSGGSLIEPPQPAAVVLPITPGPAGTAPPSGEADPAFGPLRASEWRGRFAELRRKIADQEGAVTRQEGAVARREAVPESLALERAQLDNLRGRLRLLEAEADQHRVPADLRR